MRAERSGARTIRGAGWKWRAPCRKVRGWDGWYKLSAFDRCGADGGVGSFTPASERSEHRGIWVGGELKPVHSSPGGDKDHERSEYRCILERQEFVGQSGASAEWRMTIS